MAANRESSRLNGYGNGSALKKAEEEVVKGKVGKKPSREGVCVYKDSRTKVILKVVFSELCPACEKYLKQLERELSRLRHASPNDAQVVTKLSQLIVQFTKETNQLSANLDQFEEQQWNIHGGNMHMEFSKVALETFREATNWGRVLMFLGFAVSFSVYLEQDRVVGASDSVLEWTCQLVEEELAEFFITHGGWVSV